MTHSRKLPNSTLDLRGRQSRPRPPPCMFSFKKSKGADKKALEKRFQDALWEAENSPDKRADFSECGLDSLPPQVIAACHIRKESLVLCRNMLRRIPPTIASMSALKVLDLHGNLLEELPAEIGRLATLLVLNLEGNLLRLLPSSIGDLLELQTLNLKDNKLAALPSSVGRLSRLRTLNVSGNEISVLPVELADLRVLDTFVLDRNPITFPASVAVSSSPDDVLDGTRAMKALCEAAGKQYVPPSQHLLEVLDSGAGCATIEDPLLHAKRKQEDEIRALLAHKDAIDLSRQEDAVVARRAQEEQARQLDQILTSRSAEKHEFAAHLASQEQHAEEQFRTLDVGRRRALEQFTESIRRADTEDSARAQELLAEFERVRHDPAKLQALISENDALEKAVLHRAVALQASREAAIDAVRLEESQNNQLAIHGSLRKEETRAMAVRQLAAYQTALDCQMQSFLQELDGLRITRNLEMEEQMRKDLELATGARIHSEEKQRRNLEETRKIQEELARLGNVVAELKAQKQEEKVLFEVRRRHDLEERLAVLKADYDERSAERVAHLIKIDEADQRNFRAYWEAKLQYALKHLGETAESRCDPVALTILSTNSLEKFAPLFASHKVDAIVLPILTDKDLCNMGIGAVGDRLKILAAIRDFYADEALHSITERIDHEDLLKKV